MSVFVESNIEFDFTRAVSAVQHDKPAPGHGNSAWKGIDFCIQDGQEQLWLEVKSWDPSHIAPMRRGGSRRSFLCKMKSRAFTAEILLKFLGTTAFLAWTNNFTLAQTAYVLLFQPPRPLDAALLVTFQSRIASRISRPKIWHEPIFVAVLNLAEWNQRYPDHPARTL